MISQKCYSSMVAINRIEKCSVRHFILVSTPCKKIKFEFCNSKTSAKQITFNLAQNFNLQWNIHCIATNIEVKLSYLRDKRTEDRRGVRMYHFLYKGAAGMGRFCSFQHMVEAKISTSIYQCVRIIMLSYFYKSVKLHF